MDITISLNPDAIQVPTIERIPMLFDVTLYGTLTAGIPLFSQPFKAYIGVGYSIYQEFIQR